MFQVETLAFRFPQVQAFRNRGFRRAAIFARSLGKTKKQKAGGTPALQINTCEARRPRAPEFLHPPQERRWGPFRNSRVASESFRRTHDKNVSMWLHRSRSEPQRFRLDSQLALAQSPRNHRS